MKTLLSEWTKLRTTKALWWTSALFVVFSLGFAVITALSTKALQSQPEGLVLPLGPTEAVSGLSGVGITILIIQATMVVTSEYRHNYISVTFQATPNRTLVALAKLAVYGLITAVLTLLCTVGCLVIAKALYSDAEYTLFDESALRICWVMPLFAVLVVVLTMGFSWIVRQTAGAISLMLVWYLALENVLGLLPKIGVYFQRFGPFSNLNAFLAKRSIPDAPWEYTGSLFYFILWAAVLFGLGVFLLNRRDA